MNFELGGMSYCRVPACNCSIGKMRSQFLPQTILPFSMQNLLKWRGSRYLLYWGWGWRRIKLPISTICVVLSLNDNRTDELPRFSAPTMIILLIGVEEKYKSKVFKNLRHIVIYCNLCAKVVLFFDICKKNRILGRFFGVVDARVVSYSLEVMRWTIVSCGRNLVGWLFVLSALSMWELSDESLSCAWLRSLSARWL